MADIAALGEILIDFTRSGTRPGGNALFECNPGGAPANVAVCAAKLGVKAAFIGCVGNDMFGSFLRQTLASHGVSASSLVTSRERNTTLAFVSNDASGDRSFSFYRNFGADTDLRAEDMDMNLVRSSRIFHFGSLSLTDEPSRSATIAALDAAKEAGVTVSFDPNLRPALWKSLDDAREQIESVMNRADIVKISEEELLFLTGENTISRGAFLLAGRYGIPLLLVTLGAEGAFYRTDRFEGRVPAFGAGNVVDTTGAGDCFLGAFLSEFLASGSDLRSADADAVGRCACFASAAAGICVTRRGAIDGMPSRGEVEALLALVK